ncbi:MAG: PBP1A family penicillin-binding protein [Pararoseburia sp.]|nr:PBP1A family penicillin-binding protein [Pararoseburia sp.]
MNYGKKSAKKKSDKLSKGRAKNKKKFAVTFFKTALICILVLVIAGAVGGGIYAVKLIKQCPDISEVNISPEGFSTTVLDADGNEIETLAASGSNRSYVPITDIPKDLQHAFVAIEDERFYKHNGIDMRGIVRAAFTGIISGGDFSQGASTITQQLLKNNYFTTWTSENSFSDRLERKIQEQYLAVQLEKVEDKNTILENYLNTINLGQNTLGVEAASERYFNKSVSELTLSESATIAGITQNPSKYNPISNPDQNAKRRKKVLDKMLELGYITEKEYNTALDDKVYDRIQVANAENQSNASTSYFVDALTDQVYNDLIEEKGYTESQAYKLLYSGGLTIKSTQDSNIQKICEEEVNNNANYSDHVLHSFSYRLTVTKADGSYENYSEQTMLTYYQAQNPNYDINFASEEECKEAIEAYKKEIMEKGDTIAEGGESITYTLQPQAAISVMDQSTGKVVALVGGRGEKNASKTLNRATSITRQPGSCFKIIGCYAAALDAGGLTLATVQDDAPTSYANGTPLHNYDNRYRGFTTIRDAIISSMNVVTVKNLTQIGTGLGFEYAQALGISTLEPGDNNQTLCLGGLTNGVTDLELTAAYATIANHGDYNKPVFYTEVLDNQGDVILDNTQNTSKEVLKDTTAWLLTNAMQDVITSGTGGGAGLPNMPTAGKTGTTTKNRDTVFAGYTPYYTAAVWGGYDDDTEQTYTAYSKLIWHAVMARIHEGLATKNFDQPSGIVTATVCKKSGKLAVEGVCDQDPRGSMVYTEYFDKDSVPTETCDHHVLVETCAESNQIATEFCPTKVPSVRIIGGSAGTEDEPYLITEEALNTKCTLHTKDTSKDKEEDKKKPSANGDISGGDASGDNSSKEDTPPAEPQSTLNIPNMGNVSFPDAYR